MVNIMHILQKVVVLANLTKRLLHNTQCQIFRFEKKLQFSLITFLRKFHISRIFVMEPELPGHTFKKNTLTPTLVSKSQMRKNLMKYLYHIFI